ncbi:MAG: hypothetical protein Tsb002_07750 [Wenzhouxiangellaceae bacterium]
MDDILRQINEFVDELENQQTLDELKQCFQHTIVRLGYCAFDAYSIRPDTLKQPRQKGNFCIASYPLEYIRKYVEKGFVAQCPGLREAGQARLPFDYLAYLAEQPKTAAVGWQRALYTLSNIHHAWLVPMNSSRCLNGVTVYMQGDRQADRERFQNTRHHIHLLSSHFFEVALVFDPSGIMADLLNDQPSGFDALSKRERDCLNYCARGKTNREIAVLMHVSENTVRFHMKNIFRKLDVSNRAHAISKVSGRVRMASG